uniref:Uncharacterized protein n=1 Tax=Pipistrellus kuhlii TaxID=59472 RepID=A0A7J7ZJN0_PIPKU|nr:hypothetical protein mPipKuh1_009385 [Pipistrellus kuhlii]
MFCAARLPLPSAFELGFLFLSLRGLMTRTFIFCLFVCFNLLVNGLRLCIPIASFKILHLLPKPVWLSGRASACGLKGPRFDSGQGHVHWLRAHPWWGVCRRQLVDVSLSSTFLALYPSLLLSVKNQ